MKIKNPNENSNNKNFIIAIGSFLGISLVGLLIYFFMFNFSGVKKTVDVPEKNSPEEIVTKFLVANTSIGPNEPSLLNMFGEVYEQNKQSRISACYDAKNYLETKNYENICNEAILSKSSKKIANYFTSRPENIKLTVKEKESVTVGDKTTSKVKVLVDFDVVRRNYIIDSVKSTKDKAIMSVIDKKYSVKNVTITLLNNEKNGWTIIDMDDLVNKGRDLLSTWNNIGDVIEDGEEIGSRRELEFKSDDIIKALGNPNQQGPAEPIPDKGDETSDEEKTE